MNRGDGPADAAGEVRAGRTPQSWAAIAQDAAMFLDLATIHGRLAYERDDDATEVQLTAALALTSIAASLYRLQAAPPPTPAPNDRLDACERNVAAIAASVAAMFARLDRLDERAGLA